MGWDLCPLCRIKIYFFHDLVNFEEYLDRNQFNLLKLKAYAFKLYQFLMECYHVTLKGIIDTNIDLKKRNGEVFQVFLLAL